MVDENGTEKRVEELEDGELGDVAGGRGMSRDDREDEYRTYYLELPCIDRRGRECPVCSMSKNDPQYWEKHCQTSSRGFPVYQCKVTGKYFRN